MTDNILQNFQNFKSYYNSIKDNLIKILKDKRLELIYYSIDGLKFVRIDPRFNIPIGVGIFIVNDEDFEFFNNGNLLEIRSVWSDSNYSKEFRIDIDPGDLVDFDKVKETTLKICNLLKNVGFEEVKVKFSGSRGFHVWGNFERPLRSDLYRSLIIQILIDNNVLNSEVVADKPNIELENPKIINIDLSNMKIKRFWREEFSICYKTGLIAFPLDPDKILDFDKNQANLKEFLKEGQVDIENLIKEVISKILVEEPIVQGYIEELKIQEILEELKILPEIKNKIFEEVKEKLTKEFKILIK